ALYHNIKYVESIRLSNCLLIIMLSHYIRKNKEHNSMFNKISSFEYSYIFNLCNRSFNSSFHSSANASTDSILFIPSTFLCPRKYTSFPKSTDTCCGCRSSSVILESLHTIPSSKTRHKYPV